MGLDYLWADTLCIQPRVYENEAMMTADRKKQFADMHTIYGGACFCIVAAGGESASNSYTVVGLRLPSTKDREAKQTDIVTRSKS